MICKECGERVEHKKHSYKDCQIYKDKLKRNQIIKEYILVTKRLTRKRIITKKDALDKTYEISSEQYDGRIMARLKVPISLAGLRVKLVEIKSKPSSLIGQGGKGK